MAKNNNTERDRDVTEQRMLKAVGEMIRRDGFEKLGSMPSRRIAESRKYLSTAISVRWTDCWPPISGSTISGSIFRSTFPAARICPNF